MTGMVENVNYTDFDVIEYIYNNFFISITASLALAVFHYLNFSTASSTVNPCSKNSRYAIL